VDDVRRVIEALEQDRGRAEEQGDAVHGADRPVSGRRGGQVGKKPQAATPTAGLDCLHQGGTMMDKIRGALILVGIAALSMVTTASGRSASPAAEPAAPAAIDPEVLELREAAWRAYFAGDETALGGMLSDDFIGINMFDGAFVTREAALQQARSFLASGGRLTGLEFPETRAQRYGDVVILYGRFTAVVESGGSEPKTQTMRGRLTEVFLRTGGRWLHTGWHLDTASMP
jgi:hypothetical protein